MSQDCKCYFPDAEICSKCSMSKPVESPKEVATVPPVEPVWTRETLLQRIRDCVPDVWESFLVNDETTLWVRRSNGAMQCLGLEDDVMDSGAMVMLLDELERMGWLVSLSSVLMDDGSVKYKCFLCRPNEDQISVMTWPDRRFIGPTRAWAVSAAFVAVCQARNQANKSAERMKDTTDE